MTTKKEILALVAERGIELIRFLYIDNDGVIRGYNTTAEELESDLDTGHPFAIAMPFFSVLDDLTPETRFGCTGELIGLPDPDTFRILPYVDHTAMMICDFVSKEDQTPSDLCARTLLKKYLTDLEYDVMAAFENEFYFLTRDESGQLRPFDQSLCFATGGMNQQHPIVMDLIRALKAQGLSVEKYYPEYGHGQLEIVYKYDKALASADNQVIFRETARGVAQKHGLIASFMPKPFQHLAGSGAHMHLSLWRDGKNAFYDRKSKHGISQQARYFTGGVLKHLRGLCAFTTPTVNSYKRLVPHSWASAYTCWGLDNREAAVRAISPMPGRQEQSFNLEIKPVDGTCNPHLALLTVLAAGMDGLKNQIEPGEAVAGDPYELSDEERRERGIKRLPTTLGEAAVALASDNFFADLLGTVFFEEYLALKRFAWTQYINQVSDWEVTHYADVF